MSEPFEFDSHDYPSGEAFEEYRALYSAGSDVERVGSFRARVRSLNLDGLVLFERMIDGVIHSRVKRAGQDRFRHFALHLVLDGELWGSKESGFDVARRGDLVIADTARPSRTQAVALHVVTASMPRSALVSATGGSDRLHGLVANAPATNILGDFMISCLRHGAAVPIQRRPVLISAFIDILAGVLGRESAAAVATDRRRTEMLQREAAVRFIRECLSDRDLNAAVVADAIGMSRRSLYRLFESMGGVSRVIMGSRLDAVRGALEEGSQDSLSTLAADYGFSDESHLSRRFQEAHGESISAFRRRLLTERPTQRATRQLNDWIRSVR
ncbi:helix-turn-helix domain-containing protein [Roseibacterium beibuensis]|uniref:helix-turn-helix domain-containing protein n=1 Tax=[Roseibacterium] beibuensis TaxID=1193142 RepID=UPI00217D0077|nr:helix-turn-helix domain-containing protein [Roseibacterium beibuensis]MCS6622542.1 helix-turn-helix domain-containing protein [Roseibacterium beibuensis]